MTHFYTTEGIRLIGQRVLQEICTQLDIPSTEVNAVDVVIPKLTEKLVGR